MYATIYLITAYTPPRLSLFFSLPLSFSLFALFLAPTFPPLFPSHPFYVSISLING